MRLLRGSELAPFIKERQAKQVRGLRQAENIFPRLVIVLGNTEPASATYVALKERYGQDILVEVVVEHVDSADEALSVIARHNQDPKTHGIIVQIPINEPARTDEVLQAVAPSKDVDGLGSTEVFDPATPTAIIWLLAGYNVELRGKKVVVIGNGRLVGAPLVAMLEASNIPVTIADRESDLAEICQNAEVIISATGQPGMLTSQLIPQKAVVVDAGVAGENGVLKGDVADEVYRTRDDLIISAQKGGVGPLTVCALFDNVIRAARKQAEQKHSA